MAETVNIVSLRNKKHSLYYPIIPEVLTATAPAFHLSASMNTIIVALFFKTAFKPSTAL